MLKVFSPPARRLQQIAGQLEKTGTLNAGTVAQLRQVVRVLAAAPARTDRDAAELLAQAAHVFAGRRFHDAVGELASAAGTMSAKAMDDRISHLHEAADILARAARRIQRSSQEQ